MNFISVCPYVRYANIVPTVMDGISERKAADCRLFYFLQSGIFYAGDIKYSVIPGSAVYIPAGVAYNIVGAPKAAVLNFDLSLAAYSVPSKSPYKAAEFNQNYIFDKTPPPKELTDVIFLKQAVNLEKQFKMCTIQTDITNEITAALLSALVKEILSEMANSRNEDDIELKLMLYIKENYDRNLTNTELSEVFGYHPYHINRIFKARFGTTVDQAVINERMDIACRLLADTDLSVNEITEITGYRDRIAFYSAFKKNSGSSPIEYRAKSRT